MAQQDKAAERTQLVLLLGRLLAKAHDLANAPTAPTPVEYRVAAASYRADLEPWRVEARKFCRVEGVDFDRELDNILRSTSNFFATLGGMADEPHIDDSKKRAYLKEQLKKVEQETIAAMDTLPIVWDAKLFEERTPFSACLSIRDTVSTARSRIHYFDRYLTEDFFPLYLRGVDRSVSVRLITTAGKASAVGGAGFGVQQVQPMAKLAAHEFSDFNLIQVDPTDLHDRNLRIDNQIFFLGTSVNAVGKAPTNFAPADSSPASHAILDKIVSYGKKVV